MKKHLVPLVLVLVILPPSFLGCGSGLPSEDDVKEVLAKRYLPQNEVVAVRKIDGVRGNWGGVDIYEMKVEVTLQCLTSSGGSGCRQGEINTQTRTITFRKTERGWKANP